MCAETIFWTNGNFPNRIIRNLERIRRSYKYQSCSLTYQEQELGPALPWIELRNSERDQEQSFKTRTRFWLIEQDSQPKCTRIVSTAFKSRIQARWTELKVWSVQNFLFVFQVLQWNFQTRFKRLREFWDKFKGWKWPEWSGEHDDTINSIKGWISRSIQTMFDFYLNFKIGVVEDELGHGTSPGGIAWSGRRCTREELVGIDVYRRIGGSTATLTWPEADWGRRRSNSTFGKNSPSTF